jgi:hypothetical protein
MANTVIQLVPVDPSLQNNPDFGNMQEYIINGTYYVVDNTALIIYVWNQNTPGPNNSLVNTGGSYTQFEAFLAANPPTVETNTASYPSPTVAAPEQTVLLRGILLALINLATSGNQSNPIDYYPINQALS